MSEHTAPGLGDVLVVGGTGYLGSKVVDELITRGKPVRALVRPGSDASNLEAKGAKIVRGDMLDPRSLAAAMQGADAVITTAAGYTKHRKADSVDIDTVGNTNLADAAHATKVRRFVLTSILTCDQTPQVPHFWHKKLAEDHLEELGVPFVALRPGAFLDQVAQIGGDQFAKKRINWVGNPSTPLTFVLTDDLANYLAEAVDADGVDGQRIDIGWDHPISANDLAETASRLMGTTVKVRAIPAGLVSGVGTLLGPFAPTVKDMAAMMSYFSTGKYVANTAKQTDTFGTPPQAEDAIRRLLGALGHLKPEGNRS